MGHDTIKNLFGRHHCRALNNKAFRLLPFQIKSPQKNEKKVGSIVLLALFYRGMKGLVEGFY
jgi:hypothetical protein